MDMVVVMMEGGRSTRGCDRVHRRRARQLARYRTGGLGPVMRHHVRPPHLCGPAGARWLVATPASRPLEGTTAPDSQLIQRRRETYSEWGVSQHAEGSRQGWTTGPGINIIFTARRTCRRVRRQHVIRVRVGLATRVRLRHQP
jgi:hypothetical protein